MIHSFDPNLPKAVESNLAKLERSRTYRDNLMEIDPNNIGFVKESMDVIIEDGIHLNPFQEVMLNKMFPLVKPGGYYIIEDINDNASMEQFSRHPEQLNATTRAILENNNAFFVDTSVGVRTWDQWVKHHATFGVSRFFLKHGWHNSHILVIKKRDKELRKPLMNVGRVAMKPDKIVMNSDTT